MFNLNKQSFLLNWNIVFYIVLCVWSYILTLILFMQLLDALELSRLTIKTVKQNLWWAFAYNIVSLFAW